MTTTETPPELHLSLPLCTGRYYWELAVDRTYICLKLKKRSRVLGLRNGITTHQSALVGHGGRLTQPVLNEISGKAADLWLAEKGTVPDMIRALRQLTDAKVVKG